MKTTGQILDAAANRRLTQSELASLRQAFTGKGSSKPPHDPLKKRRWYKMAAYWDGPARKVMEMGDQGIILQGTVGEDMAVCLVPPAVGPQQGDALRILLQANLRLPVLVLSNNVHLCKLVPVTEAAAREIMQAANKSSDGEEKDLAAAGALEEETNTPCGPPCPPAWNGRPDCIDDATHETCPMLGSCKYGLPVDDNECPEEPRCPVGWLDRECLDRGTGETCPKIETCEVGKVERELAEQEETPSDGILVPPMPTDEA